MAENTDALTQENNHATETVDAAFEHVIEGPNGQSVQFCSLEERRLAQETAQKEREELDPQQATHRSLRAYLSYLDQALYSARTLNRHLSALRLQYVFCLP